MMRGPDERMTSGLRLIRVIAKLRQRQLQLARRGKVAESAHYAERVRRISRSGTICT